MCPVHCTTEDKFCLGKMENGIKIKRDNCFSNNGKNPESSFFIGKELKIAVARNLHNIYWPV